MKARSFTLLAAALLLFNQLSLAKILRVGYVGPLVSGVDYANVNDAYTAANDGDTLQCYPGSSGVANYYISSYDKRLVLTGNGYLLSGTGANTELSRLTGKVGFSIYPVASSTGSNGTIMEGFDNAIVYLSNNVAISDITIRRCKSGYFQGYSITATLTDCKIQQCFSAYFSNMSGASLTLNNFRVENCILNGGLPPLSPASTVLISNCYYAYAPDMGDNNVVVQNCIFSGGAGDGTGVSNAVFNNNIFSWHPNISGANNQWDVNVGNAGADVMVGFPTQGSYSDDARYQLTSTSPAKGAGVGGVDIGIFGGGSPYHLSGLPPVPAIYKLEAASPNATTNPYPVTISVRSNN